MYSKENSKKDVHETVALRSAILTENWSSTMVEQSEKRGPRADSLREPIYTRKHPIAATRKPATVLMMTWLTSEPLSKSYNVRLLFGSSSYRNPQEVKVRRTQPEDWQVHRILCKGAPKGPRAPE